MSIRVRQTQDFDLILHLDRKMFPLGPRLCNQPGSVWFLAWYQGEAIAYAGLQPTGFLSRCGVLPEYQGQGLQKRLINARIRWAKANDLKYVWSYTWSSNYKSMRSMISCGMRPYDSGYEDDFVYFALRFDR